MAVSQGVLSDARRSPCQRRVGALLHPSLSLLPPGQDFTKLSEVPRGEASPCQYLRGFEQRQLDGSQSEEVYLYPQTKWHNHRKEQSYWQVFISFAICGDTINIVTYLQELTSGTGI
ncbi:UNVERIFIED_CONTAM: hypothetical protein FKN15_062658 [Acipenser sinensis]